MATKTPAKKSPLSGLGRKKASDRALTDFSTRFAKKMGSPAVVSPETTYTAIPTGSLELDALIGIGGWPVGRVIEVWGPEHSGKTTLAMLTAAEAQRVDPDRHVAWIDMEQTFDSTWARKLGVDLDRLHLYTPLTAEDVSDAAREFMSSGIFSLVVLDSIGGMISRVEFEKEADEATVGKVPNIVTRMVKQAAPLAFRNETTVMVINQVRAVIGGHGPTESTGGGWALKHVTSVKVHTRRGEPVKGKLMGNEVNIGHQVICRVEKNKVNGRVGRAQFLLISQPNSTYPLVGVDVVSESFDVAQKVGVLPRTAWVTLPDGQKINGRTKAIPYLQDHPETVQMLREGVLEAVANGDMADDNTEELIDAELENLS